MYQRKSDAVCVSSGTYNDQLGLAESSACQKCPPGAFCNETGLEAVSGQCDAGYLCVLGASHPGPDDGVNGPCPRGYYCLQGKNCR